MVWLHWILLINCRRIVSVSHLATPTLSLSFVSHSRSFAVSLSLSFAYATFCLFFSFVRNQSRWFRFERKFLAINWFWLNLFHIWLEFAHWSILRPIISLCLHKHITLTPEPQSEWRRIISISSVNWNESSIECRNTIYSCYILIKSFWQINQRYSLNKLIVNSNTKKYKLNSSNGTVFRFYLPYTPKYISNLYERFKGMRRFDMHEKNEIRCDVSTWRFTENFSNVAYHTYREAHSIDIHVRAKRTIKMWFKLMSNYTVICVCWNKNCTCARNALL